jgi:hypothetical protein
MNTPPYFSRNCLPYLRAILFSVCDRVNKCKHKTKFTPRGFGGLCVSVLAFVPKVAGSNPFHQQTATRKVVYTATLRTDSLTGSLGEVSE